MNPCDPGLFLGRYFSMDPISLLVTELVRLMSLWYNLGGSLVTIFFLIVFKLSVVC